MPPISTPHSLFGPAPPATPRTGAAGVSQSGYCYLFPDLARRADVGCFRGTTPAETFRRLRTFEKDSRSALSAPQVLPMRLAPVYTYFGQFVNHDISAPVGDVVTLAAPPEGTGVIDTGLPPGLDRSRRASPEVILANFVNEQAEPLALDSLYGDGPDSADPGIRALYATDGKRFRLGKTRREPDQFFIDKGRDPARIHHDTEAPDILRRDGQPLIADRRNDENLIVSQLHLALMLVHNKAVTALEPGTPDPATCFAKARQLVTLHYHWLILHDFLANLLAPDSLRTPLADRAQKLPAARLVPLEFTTAAFRFGHSMVGTTYDFNRNFGRGGRFDREGAKLQHLFDFTTQRNMGQPGLAETLQLPDHWVIDWDRMTRRPDPTPSRGPGGAEQIDLTFAPEMLNAMGTSEIAAHGSILFRNLMRGFHRRIAFGQALAGACGLEAMDEDQLRAALPESAPGAKGLRELAEELGMLAETPAWLYVLAEARHHGRGEHLGPVASEIIADTITGLMRHMPQSILNHAGGSWHPAESPLKGPGNRALTSLRSFLRFAVQDSHSAVAPA
ncbi:MAG: peroxidase family protein [Tabrizicola sp.]